MSVQSVNVLALPFSQQRPLELCEGSHDRQHELRHRCVLASEGQVLLQERDARTARGEVLHEPPQIVEVAGQAIHAVDHHRIAFTHEGEQRFQRCSLSILTGCRVRIHAIHQHLL
jgi:hypothetical protein